MKMKKEIVFFLSLSLFMLFGIKSQSVQAAETDTYQTSESSYKTVINTRDSMVKLYAKGNDGVFRIISNRVLGPSSSWATDKQVYNGVEADGTHATFYRVATNEWMANNSDGTAFGFEVRLQNLPGQVDNYPPSDAKVITVKNGVNAPIYDSYGHKTDKTLPANSSWLTDRYYSYGSGIPLNFVAYRIGNNQWLSLEDINVTASY